MTDEAGGPVWLLDSAGILHRYDGATMRAFQELTLTSLVNVDVTPKAPQWHPDSTDVRSRRQLSPAGELFSASHWRTRLQQ
ncbi:MAG: hypothetical protein WDZ52_10010 [Pseudohongiellaceae bacterium]